VQKRGGYLCMIIVRREINTVSHLSATQHFGVILHVRSVYLVFLNLTSTHHLKLNENDGMLYLCHVPPSLTRRFFAFFACRHEIEKVATCCTQQHAMYTSKTTRRIVVRKHHK
jgi:hypothetical protein